MRFNNRALLGVLGLLAVVLFCVRGPRRALADSGDFATVYSAARCWEAHENPYLEANIDRQYASGHGDPARAPNPELTESIYLPSIFPLVAPIARFDWETAKRLWLIVELAAFAVSLVCVARAHLETAAGMVIAFLFFSATQTGLSKGQPGVLCISLLVAAMYLRTSPRAQLLAGLLLGISCCVKPNVALPFVLFLCWRKQWRAVAASLAMALAVWAIALKNLLGHGERAISGAAWWTAWSANLKMASAPGGNMDPTLASTGSHWLSNFQTVVGFFTTNQQLCNWATYSLLGALVIAVLAATRFQMNEWLALALLSTLLLLGSYHRYYDLQLLMLCGNAALLLYRKGGAAAWIAGAAALALWFPLQGLAAARMPVPAPGAASFAQFLAFRNQPLCLLVLALVFAWALIRKNFQPRKETLQIYQP